MSFGCENLQQELEVVFVCFFKEINSIERNSILESDRYCEIRPRVGSWKADLFGNCIKSE